MNPFEERRDSEACDRPEACVEEMNLDDVPKAFRGENALGKGSSEQEARNQKHRDDGRASRCRQDSKPKSSMKIERDRQQKQRQDVSAGRGPVGRGES